MVSPDLAATMQPRLEEGQKIMVAARGITPVLSFALDEAQLRKATLCCFRQGNCGLLRRRSSPLGRARWQDDPEANAIMSFMLKLGCGTRNLRDTGLCRERRSGRHHSRSLCHHGCRLSYARHLPPHCLTNLLRGNVVTNIVAAIARYDSSGNIWLIALAEHGL